MAISTIVLQGDLARYHGEGTAGATIKPGHLIMLSSDGKFDPHGTAGALTSHYFAKEDALQGKTIDDNYVDTQKMFYHKAQKGDRIYVLLANGENAAIGAGLSSNGDGTFQVVAGAEIVLMRAMEALNNTSGVAARIQAEVV